VMAVGSFLIQGPIGRAADRRGTRGVLLWALAVLAVSLAMLPLASRGQWILWPLALVWGGASGCLYTLAMTGAAQSFAARQVAMVTTLMVLGYTVGSTLGPVLGGIAVEASPLAGVVWIFGTLSVVGWFMAFRQKPARSWDGQH
jgi:predicted MFS family arabinose efflux permease